MACDDCERLRQERDTFYMDYRLKCDVETKAAHLRAEKAERERDEAREACVNSANAWLAAANHAEKAEQERDEWIKACQLWVDTAKGESERAEKAEQENARLREALAELVRLDDQYRPDPAPHEWSNAWTAARTALGGE
jgi:hypothetical protein